MARKSKTLAQALIAGLAAGLSASAGIDALHARSALAADSSVGATSTSPIPTTKPKRKPHNGIRNKNNCCKNGCDCMESKTKKNAPSK